MLSNWLTRGGGFVNLENKTLNIAKRDIIISNHGRIIKWTQHIGFLTLAEMARVVERNHGNDSI